MRMTALIICCQVLSACGSPEVSNGATTAASLDPERQAIAQRADNPDFSAVDALANGSTPTTGEVPATSHGTSATRLPDVMPVVTDPVAAMKAAIAVSARGDDGLKTLPMAPDLLVVYRRHEQRDEVGNFDHDFLTGMQETLPLRVSTIASRKTPGGIEVSSRTVTQAGPRDMVALWSPRGDGSWQLDDIRAEGTTLLALLASDDT